MTYEAEIRSDRMEKPVEAWGEIYLDMKVRIDAGIGTFGHRLHILLKEEPDTRKTTVWVNGKRVKVVDPRRYKD